MGLGASISNGGVHRGISFKVGGVILNLPL